MLVTPRGDINSPLWFICGRPTDSEAGTGTLITGAEAFHLSKLLTEMGLPDPYITSIEYNTLITYDTQRPPLNSFLDWLPTIHNKPTFVCLYGKEAAEALTPETRNYKKPHDTKLDKWAGSLLISPYLNWPHYCIPLWPINQFFIDWSYRDIYKNLDLGHVKDEYDSFTSTGTLNPLPVYSINSSPTYTEVVDWLDYCRVSNYVSADIETIRPPRSCKDADGVAGHMYTIALAPNNRESCAIQLWNWSSSERRIIWTKLNSLLKNVSVIGQNYFQFDTHYEEAYALEPALDKIHDTRIRHHILWPELPHSLQFQTKQYTRQKYYKDEGKTWSPKQLKQLLNYNALDTLVTYKIFEEQEVEFDERPHLR